MRQLVADAFAPGLISRLQEPPSKVVVVRASRIGDFICATPAFRALRAALPNAHITVIALPFNHGIAERLATIARFVPFPGYPGIAERFFDARQATSFFHEMQDEHFDLAIQLHGSGVNANPFTLMLGAKVTAGFVRPEDPAGRLDAALALPERGHETERVLSLITFLGIPPRGLDTEFPLLGEDIEVADSLLNGYEPPFIGLHAAAREEGKRWPPKRFAEAGRALQKCYGGTLVVIGGGNERKLSEEVLRTAGVPGVNLAGRTTVPILGAVIARLSVLVTNDSGPAHIAYALGTPSVTIFGSTDPERWGPPAHDRHRIVVPRSKPETGSITSITVSDVVTAAMAAVEHTVVAAETPASG